MKPLIVLFGPTASGKTALSLALARRFGAHILSCDSVCVYRHMELGTAKPTPAERAEIPHHLLDLYDPDQACTAGDYARHARHVLGELDGLDKLDGTLPILTGGTGLYFRALLDGLFPAPPVDPNLRARLRTRPPAHLHRLLTRLDPAAARLIHPNDLSKTIRAIEVSLAVPPGPDALRRPLTEQWTEGRDALSGYRILRLGLNPPRPQLYDRINQRAQQMFDRGLVEETRALIARFGPGCRPFTSLGYAQAAQLLAGTLTQPAAIEQAQQGHRNYAKRQQTWFRREAELHQVHWLSGPGDDPTIQAEAADAITQHLSHPSLLVVRT